MNIEARKRLESFRDATASFIGTSVQREFVLSTQRQIDEVVEELSDVDAPLDANRLIFLKGQLSVLKPNLTLFEDALSTLEDKIQEALDIEAKATENNEIKSNEEI